MKQPQFVICIQNKDYPVSLEKRKIYKVVEDPEAEEIGHMRVIDESGEDYLYPATCLIDANLPKEVQAAIVKAAKQAHAAGLARRYEARVIVGK